MAARSYATSILCASLGLFSLGSCSLLFGESREASDGGLVTSDGGQDGFDAAVFDAAVFDAAVFDAAVFDASPACVWRQGAMGWWRAEDPSAGSTVTDSSSGGSHNGTKAGVSYSPGKVGNAFNFSGVGRIQILDPGRVFFPNQDFSMELWVKRAGNAGKNPVLLSQNECGGALPGTECPQQSHWWLKFQADQFAFVVSRGTGTPANAQVVTSGVGYSDNEFHHVVIQRDTVAGKLRIYVDGEDVSNLGTIPNDLAVPDLDMNQDDPMYFGAVSYANNTWGGQFEGLIDEVAYYDYVLSPEQVSALHAETDCP